MYNNILDKLQDIIRGTKKRMELGYLESTECTRKLSNPMLK